MKFENTDQRKIRSFANVKSRGEGVSSPARTTYVPVVKVCSVCFESSVRVAARIRAFDDVWLSAEGTTS
jgi:hypothetical protein